MMKDILRVIGIATVLAAATAMDVEAQRGLANYQFSTGVDASRWVALSNTTNICSSGDYGVSSLQPIGFAFPFGDTVYTTFSVNADGVMKLGSPVTTATPYSSPLSSGNAGANSPKIVGWGRDGYLYSGIGHVYYETFGDTMLVVDYLESPYANNAILAKFQIQLFRSGRVQIVYGTPTGTPTDGQIGMCIDASDGWVVSANGASASHFTAGNSTEQDSYPENGRWYHWKTAKNCSYPTTTAVSDITATGFTVTWSAVAGATQYLVRNNTTDRYVTGTSYTISGLGGCSGEYAVGVAAVCGSSLGDTSFLNVKNVAMESGSALLSENFDSYTGDGVSTGCDYSMGRSFSTRTMPTGWWFPGVYFGNSPSDATPNIWLSRQTCTDYAPAALSGSTTHMEFKHTSGAITSTKKSYAAMPVLSVSASAVNLTFKYLLENTGTSIWLGIITDLSSEANAIASYQRLKEYTAVDTWTTVNEEMATLLAADYAPGTYRFVLEYYNSSSGSGYRGYVDEVAATTVACPSPAGFRATAMTDVSLRLEWTASLPAGAYFTVYKDDVEIGTTTENHYDITGLTPLTMYIFKVRTDCPLCEQESEEFRFRIRTMCPGSVTLPYSENFDWYSQDVTGGTVPASYPAHTMPSCWTFSGLSGSRSSYPQVYLSTSNAQVLNGLRFLNGGDNQASYAALPLVSGYDVAHLRIDFWYRQSATNGTVGQLTLGTMEDPNNPTTFVALRSLGKKTDWTRIQDTVGLHDPAPTARYLAFRYSGGTSSAQWTVIDSVRVTGLTCLPVSNLHAENITTTSLRLAWDEHNNGTTAYTITFNGNNYTTAPGASYYDFTGLNKGQPCAFTVAPNCAGDTRVLYTATLCDEGVSLPYHEPFDYYGGPISTGTGAPTGYPNHTLPHCWEFLNLSTSTSTYPQVFLTNSGTYRTSGNGLLFRSDNIHPAYAVLPLPTGGVPTARLRLEFQYKQSVVTDNVGVLAYGVMSDPSNARTFVELGTLNKTTAWTHIVEDIGALPAFKAVFSTTDRPHVAFRYTAGASNSAYTAIENVWLKEICFGGLEADSVLPTQCRLRWSDFSGGANSYTIRCNGVVVATTAAGVEQYWATGLMGGTTYTFTVTPSGAGCDPLTIEVHTPCAGGTLPYAEDFNGFATGNSGDGVSTSTSAPTTSGHHYNNNANAMPACWYLINRSSSTSTYPQMFLTSSSSYRVSGNGFLFKGRSTEGPALAVVATNFGVPASQMVVSFQYKVSNTNYPKVEYGVMANPGDPSSFIPLGYTKSTGWTAVRDSLVNHPNLPGGTLYLAFRYSSTSTSTYYGAIDDVRITLLPECGVYGLEVTPLNSTAARLTWRKPYGATNYTYTIRQNGVEIGSTGEGDTSYTVTGLSTGTDYDFTVTASCGSSSTVHFRLDGYGCIDPTDLTAAFVTAYYGTYPNPYASRGVINHGPADGTSRHTVHTDVNERDARTGNQLPTVPPGHTKSVRLGNWSTSKQAESLVYALKVDTLISDLLILKYAAVLQVAGHQPHEQPRFTLEIVDDNMSPIDPTCGTVDFIASRDLGWHQQGSGNNGVLWKDWTSIGIDLKAYHGETVYIRLTTYDCAQSAHYGYAYFTLECQRRNIASSSCGETTLGNTFTAPDGFSYQWYTDTLQAPIATTRTLELHENVDKIFCRLTFVDIPGCNFMMSSSAGVRYPLSLFDTAVTTHNCQFDVSFMNHSTITVDHINPIGTGESCETAEWHFPGAREPDTVDTYHAVAHYDHPGTYEVTLVSAIAGGECTDTLRWTMALYSATVPTLEGPAPHCPGTVPDTLVVRHAVASEWPNDTLIVNPQITTTYNVVATDSNGCTHNLSYTIVIGDATPTDSTAVECDSFTWRGTTYTTSGDYTHMGTNASGCDEEQRLHLTINNSNTGDTVVDVHDDFTWYGTTYTESGTATHTFTNADGCDSVVTLHLTITRNTQGYESQTVCDSLEWKGNTYNTSGVYIFDTLNVAGADSTLYLTLTVNYSSDSTVRDTIVENQLPYTFNGTTFTEETPAADVVIANAVGCDSTIHYSLYVYHNIIVTVDSILCDDRLPLVWNGETFSGDDTRSVTLRGQHGEDSVVTMTVHANPTYTVDDHDTIVENQLPYQWEGYSLTGSGDQMAMLTSVQGCDSVVTMHLKVWMNKTVSVDSTVCADMAPIDWNGEHFDASDTRTITLTGEHGEDSVVTMTVQINPVYPNVDDYDTIVENALPYRWESYSLTGSGEQTANLLTRERCDSVVTMHLHVWMNTSADADSTVCENQLPVVWNGKIFTDDWDQSATLRGQHGEDSVVRMTLVVNPTYATEEEATICDNEHYDFSGSSYNRTGRYAHTLTSRDGCDSVATLVLTVNRTYQVSRSEEICANSSYEWGTPSRTIWTALQAGQSGASQRRNITETDRLRTVLGCDSTSTLNLTVHGVYLDEREETICFGESYQWRQWTLSLNSEENNREMHKTYYDSIATRALGCDSIFKLSLTQRAHPVVSFSDDRGCTHKVSITVDAPYHIVSAEPADPDLAGYETGTYFEVNPEEPTVYTVLADYSQTPTCPYTASITLDHIYPPTAELKIAPEALTSDKLEYDLYDAGNGRNIRRWFIDGEEQGDTAWHIKRMGNIEHDSIVISLMIMVDGCGDTTTEVLRIRHNAIFIPNAFTPELETNNRFVVTGADIESGELSIYNRQGLLLYRTTDLAQGWDGRMPNGSICPQGDYIWQLSYRLIGRPDAPFVETGSILLIR